MASILNKSNHLKKKASKLKRKSLLFGIIGGLSFFAAPLSTQLLSFEARFKYGMIVFMLFGAIFFICSIISTKYSKEYSIIASGLEGEQSAIRMFEKLPSDYTVINDLEIEVEGKKSQIDSVVISPNGVFIIETKNVKGEVVGNADEQNIRINKIGQKGGEYSSTMYNPIKQVNTHVYRLSKLLKNNNLNVWVQGIVYFSNPQTQVYLNSEITPVFSCSNDGERDLRQFILDYNNQLLSKEEQSKIVNILGKYIIN